MKPPPLIPAWLLLATAAAIILAVCTTAGCATFAEPWVKAHDAAPNPWFYVYALDVDAACRLQGAQASAGNRIHGCALRERTHCLIILPEEPPAWLVAHEERHCEGWDHD